MQFHIIFDHHDNLRGYTTSDEQIELFKKYRNMKKYIIRSYDKKQLPKSVRVALVDQTLLIDQLYDIYLFQDEYIEVLEEVTRHVRDIYSLFDMLHYCVQYTKLTDEEKEIVYKFTHMGQFTIRTVDIATSTGENELFEVVIKMKKLVLDVLKDMGH